MGEGEIMKDGRNVKYKIEEVRKYKKQKNKRKNAKKQKGNKQN